MSCLRSEAVSTSIFEYTKELPIQGQLSFLCIGEIPLVLPRATLSC